MSDLRSSMNVMRSLFVVCASLALCVGCEDDDLAECGPGTVRVGDECVVDTDAADTGESDTGDDDATDADLPDSSDITGHDGTTDAEGSCSASEAGQTDFGGECSRDCECRTDLDGYCYDGPYLDGFRFCTRDGGLAGELNAEQYPTLSYNSECWAFPSDQWLTPMTKSCTTLSDCTALSDRYTHCGTGDLAWASSFGTQCPDIVDTDDTSILTSKNVCIIATLPPFDRRAATEN